MKIRIAFALIVVLAAPAKAVDINGKWGIGANLFDGKSDQVSLIHGHSDRTAWILDLAFLQTEDTGQGRGVLNRLDLGAGPRFRRYLRPSEDFSPYWDGWISGIYQERHYQGSRIWGAGVGGGFDFGLEYFTRWHCSAAIHSPVISGSWIESHFHGSDYSFYPPPIVSTTTHSQTSSLGLRPTLVLRA